MTLKPPSPGTGQAGLLAFRDAVKLEEDTLRTRFSRAFHRKELGRWQKLYASLAAKREAGSPAAAHFSALSILCGDLLEEFGEEAPARKRMPRKSAAVPLTYPDFPDEITHRLHFLEGPGLRRVRTVDLARHAAAVSRQTSGKGRVLVSVGVPALNVRLFERLVEAIGDNAQGDLSAAGFDTGYVMRPEGVAEGQSWYANPLDPASPIARIWSDNQHARGYSWQARALGEQWRGADGDGLPDDLPEISDHPWDPDPFWQEVLDLTQADRLDEALARVETVPGCDREALFDEVIYLRFLTGSAVRAQDVCLLARRHAERSLIAGRMLEDFEAFLDHLQTQFELEPPIYEEMTVLRPGFGEGAMPPMTPAADWPAYRRRQASFTAPSAARGRIFSLNIGVADTGAQAFFAGALVAAEEAFRRARSIPEIGKGWVSERALLDLVRSFWPAAIHQWRPSLLGMRSVDIFVPEIGLAIEYQGQQHYLPVALFGGEEGLELTRARDERKRARLARHGIPLLEWPYDVEISRAALVNRLIAMGIAVPGTG